MLTIYEIQEILRQYLWDAVAHHVEFPTSNLYFGEFIGYRSALFLCGDTEAHEWELTL